MCHLCQKASMIQTKDSKLMKPIFNLLIDMHKHAEPHLGNLWLWRLDKTESLRRLVVSTNKVISLDSLSSFLEEIDEKIEYIIENMADHEPRDTIGRLKQFEGREIKPSDSASIRMYKEIRKRGGKVNRDLRDATAASVEVPVEELKERPRSPLDPSMPRIQQSVRFVRDWLERYEEASEPEEEKMEDGSSIVSNAEAETGDKPEERIKLWRRLVLRGRKGSVDIKDPPSRKEPTSLERVGEAGLKRPPGGETNSNNSRRPQIARPAKRTSYARHGQKTAAVDTSAGGMTTSSNENRRHRTVRFAEPITTYARHGQRTGAIDSLRSDEARNGLQSRASVEEEEDSRESSSTGSSLSNRSSTANVGSILRERLKTRSHVDIERFEEPGSLSSGSVIPPTANRSPSTSASTEHSPSVPMRAGRGSASEDLEQPLKESPRHLGGSSSDSSGDKESSRDETESKEKGREGPRQQSGLQEILPDISNGYPGDDDGKLSEAVKASRRRRAKQQAAKTAQADKYQYGERQRFWNGR